MARTEDGLQIIAPHPVDEQTPLLGDGSTPEENANSALEAQAQQEQREHDAGTVPLVDEPDTKALISMMSGVWTCAFFAALDTTVVATLTGPISSSFNSGTSFSWIASGYLIANAAFQPLSGKLTDIYGRRAGLVFASSFFATGTLICGLAPNAITMIIGRVIAGSGGGCINTVGVFIASDLIPLRRRGVWQGFVNIIYGTGMGLGGVFGGFINDQLNWRYAFYIQVPFIALAGIWAVIRIKIPIKKSDKPKISRVDFLGAFTLVIALVLFLLGLNSGGNIVPWNHPLVYVPLALSVVFFGLFVFVEERIASEPIIPVRLLLNRSVAASCLTNWFVTMSVFGLLYYVPIFFQVVRGVSATRAGTMFIPQAAGTAAGSLMCGLIMRWTGKYWWLNIFVQLNMILANALIFGLFNGKSAEAVPYICLLLQGLSYGSTLTLVLISMISAVDHKYQAIVTSASYAFRSTGSTIGITAAGAVFQNLLKKLLFDRFGDEPGAADYIKRIRQSTDEIRNLPPEWRAGVIDAYIEALRGVWAVILAFAVLAAISSVFIREHKLYNNLERK